MLNKFLILLSSLIFLFSCEPKTNKVETIKHGELTVQWVTPAQSISTIELLEYNFTLDYPLGTEVDIQTANMGKFFLVDQSKAELPPSSPNSERSQYKFLFEPPEPGKFSLPVLSLHLKEKGALVIQTQSPNGEIVISSNNPNKNFAADHTGDLKRRPSKWLLLSLLFFTLPFIPRKKQKQNTEIEILRADDVENCKPDFDSIETLLLKIIQQETNEVETDLTNASQHLSKENSFHMDLQNFIQDYLKSRYAIKGKNPAELISELNKIYRRRKP